MLPSPTLMVSTRSSGKQVTLIRCLNYGTAVESRALQ
jgi:hypothetical protein